MSNFQITRSWLENTSDGHDKFYQPFLIEQFHGGARFTTHVVCNYGPRKVSEGVFHRPVKGGQVTFYLGGQAKYTELIHAKVKKGYVRQSGHEMTMSLEEPEFLVWVKAQFGATHGHKLLQHFGLTLDGEDVQGYVPAQPSDEPDTDDSEPMPAIWGTW